MYVHNSVFFKLLLFCNNNISDSSQVIFNMDKLSVQGSLSMTNMTNRIRSIESMLDVICEHLDVESQVGSLGMMGMGMSIGGGGSLLQSFLGHFIHNICLIVLAIVAFKLTYDVFLSLFVDDVFPFPSGISQAAPFHCSSMSFHENEIKDVPHSPPPPSSPPSSPAQSQPSA